MTNIEVAHAETFNPPISPAQHAVLDYGVAAMFLTLGFSVLSRHRPAAALAFINGAMIGGFALAAAPAEYGVTGVKTFMVSHDGVVYEKDFGSNTHDALARLDRFNPDSSWRPLSSN